MGDEDRPKFPQVSRSGRILKKSAKWLEAEKSLEEASFPLQTPSRKKPWLFHGSAHFLYEQNKNGKRFDSKSHYGSVHSASASSRHFTLPSSTHSTFTSSVHSSSTSSIYSSSASLKYFTSASSIHSTFASSVNSTFTSSVNSTPASSVHSTPASSVHSTPASSIYSTSSSIDEYGMSTSESTSENDNQCCSSSDLSLESECEKFENVLAFRDKKTTDHKYCSSQLVRTGRKPARACGSRTTNLGENILENAVRTRELNKEMLRDQAYQKKLSTLYQHLPLREISEMVGEAWKADPRKEKYFWIWSPEQLSHRNQIPNISQTGDAAAPGTIVVFCPVREVPECDDDRLKKKKTKNCEKHVLGVAPVDAASHLILLGQSLTEIADKVLEAGCEPSIPGVNSLLLDTLLCSVGALLCLTREIHGLENLPEDSFKKTLDHIAYFLPGM